LKDTFCEYAGNLINSNARNPHFSWVINAFERGKYQKAKELYVVENRHSHISGGEDSYSAGKVVSQQTMSTKFDAVPLDDR
jgi:hypothetical protein